MILTGQNNVNGRGVAMKFVLSATGLIIVLSVLVLAYYGFFAQVIIEESSICSMGTSI